MEGTLLCERSCNYCTAGSLLYPEIVTFNLGDLVAAHVLYNTVVLSSAIHTFYFLRERKLNMCYIFIAARVNPVGAEGLLHTGRVVAISHGQIIIQDA